MTYAQLGRGLSALVVALACSFGTTTVAHAVPLLRTFGGPEGFGTNVLPSNDDGSSSARDLTGAFSGGLRFFGGPYTEFWVNNNGNISFNGDIYTFTPEEFPVAEQPMIAPYWGDVDTRNRDDVSAPTENLVYWHLEPGRLVVTWYNVGYFSYGNDKRMSFQLILTNALDCGSGDFDVDFRYETCELTAGGASGGTDGLCEEGDSGCTPAQAGFDAGNEMDYVALPNSFTNDILDLCTTSNVGMPGIWRFSVRSGGVVCPSDMPCDIPDQVGPCAVGRTQCVGGDVVCQPITTATDERCDGVDNDCNGEPDDGDNLCGAGQTCRRGTCVPVCFEGGCDEGFSCDPDVGACVETACVGVECEVGQRCEGGECIDACEGIVCPHGDVCISGTCVDPCAAVTCEASQFCRDGLCVARCPCSPCPAGETCNADGTCTPRGCDIVQCQEGSYCEEGVCHNSCDGVVCPSGQVCMVGACVNPTPSSPPDAGVSMVDAGSLETDAGSQADAGISSMIDGGHDEVHPPPVTGCGCRVAPKDGAPTWAFGLLAAVGFVVARRRRR
jgi:MYXO-CTERM domain-containing protein